MLIVPSCKCDILKLRYFKCLDLHAVEKILPQQVQCTLKLSLSNAPGISIIMSNLFKLLSITIINFSILANIQRHSSISLFFLLRWHYNLGKIAECHNEDIFIHLLRAEFSVQYYYPVAPAGFLFGKGKSSSTRGEPIRGSQHMGSGAPDAGQGFNFLSKKTMNKSNFYNITLQWIRTFF